MALFMDFHKFEGKITIDDIKAAHMADQAVQDQFGVKYLQFWVNEEAGTVFCLTEGPDKEACEKVHRMAHGNVACALVEVEPGFYRAFMGDGTKVDHGLVHLGDGSLDLGYRFIVIVSVRGVTTVRSSGNIVRSQPAHARNSVRAKISESNGRDMKWGDGDNLIGVFNDSTTSIRCALEIQKDLIKIQESEPGISFKIGIGAGQPVTKDGEFFTEAIKLANHMTNIAQEGQIVVSSLVKNLCKDEALLSGKNSSISVLGEPEESFVSNLLSIAEEKLADDGFTIETLCLHLGLSRPQLYRKITSLTGRAPNDLLRDIRMDKAINHLKRNAGNISEVALEVGYSNASYFSKCFLEKFGCTPSEFVEASKN